MRKLAIVMALASTAIAGPALARDKAWYIGVEGGPSIVENIQYDIAGSKAAATSKQKAGYDVDGIIGYDFGAFRLEAEVGYKEAKLRSYTSSVATYYSPTANLAPGTYNGVVGKVSALSFMMNGLLDFGSDDGISGFVGGGVGVARVKYNGFTTGGPSPFLNDSSTGFAYQAIAGVRAPLTDHIDVGLKYRFFTATSVNVVDALGQQEHSRYRSHSILGSLIYNFG
jgi:OOP family OmpA-OmpF porin